MDETEIPPWLASAARQVDAVIRQGMPIVRAAQQHVEEARAAQAEAGRPLLSGRDVALAMDAGMRELLAAVRQQANQKRGVSVELPTARVTIAALPVSVVVGGSGAMAPMRAAGLFEVGTATDTLTVEKDAQTDPGMPLDAKTVFLAVLWVFTILLPLKMDQLPPEVQIIIRDYVSTVGVTLAIWWRVNDGRKRD
jgi:hypothetical protein